MLVTTQLSRRRAVRRFGTFALAALTTPILKRASWVAPDHAPADRLGPLIAQARCETNRFNHTHVGTEHLLLALAAVAQHPTHDGRTLWRVFGGLDLHPRRVTRAVEFVVGICLDRPRGEIPLTPRAERAIRLARDEARRLGSSTVGSEHLLLGLLREGEGIAAWVLHELGVDLAWARGQITRGGDPAGPPPLGPGEPSLPSGWGRPASGF